MAWKPITLGGYELADGGLVVTGTPSLSDAGAVGEWLGEFERRNQRWLGQWYLDIQQRFPGQYSQLLDSDLHDERTLAEYARVVQRVRDWKPAVSFSAHQAVAALDRPTQRRILDKAETERLTVAQVRQEARRAARTTIARTAARGKYRVLYIGPQWTQGTLDELAQLDVPGLTTANAAVFLWVEESPRDDVIALYEQWGVRKVGTIVWNTQENAGPTAYLSIRHEYLLWMIRGRCPPDNLVPLQESVVSVARPEPGTRPERFREIVDHLYDHGSKLELYARHQRELEGWTFVGKPTKVGRMDATEGQQATGQAAARGTKGHRGRPRAGRGA